MYEDMTHLDHVGETCTKRPLQKNPCILLHITALVTACVHKSA